MPQQNQRSRPNVDPRTSEGALAVARRIQPINPARFAHVQAAIKAIADGQMVILVDDEDRENEGDLVLAGELVTPEAINFMAKHARGLICLAMDETLVEKLALPMMVEKNTASLGTAFTISIEARHGVTTGISAQDRAHTIRVALHDEAKPADLVSPGHIFPLRARPGGVLQRTGQTEGSVDLARLAGLKPAGVICEIMNDDGSMARMPDLERFASEHHLLVLTIADLIQYRLQTESLVTLVRDEQVRLDSGSFSAVLGQSSPSAPTWRAMVFEVAMESRQFLALSLGNLANSSGVGLPPLCRVHAGSTFGDVFGSTPFEGGRNLRAAIAAIEREGRGLVLYLPGRTDLAHELDGYLKAHKPRSADKQTLPDPPLREFGLGAQCLVSLGLTQIRLLTNNPRKIAGLAGFGLDVVDCVPLD